MALDLGKRLLEAARCGNDDEVRQLMQSGAPFTTDWLGTSPLHLAAQSGHFSTVKVLLQAGISRDARTKVDRTPLHLAADEGHAHIVDLLIKNGASVNARDMLEMTPLHWAAERDRQDVVDLLLKSGADINAYSKFGKTAFDIALEKNNPVLLILMQEAIQGKVRTNNAENITVSTPQFIFASGDIHSTGSAEIVSGDLVGTSVDNSGQRVITIVTDGVQLGSLHGGFSTEHMRHPLLVTIQNGEQVVAVPEEDVIEEVVEELESPPNKRLKIEVVENNSENSTDKHAGEATKFLQQQLQEANRRAQEYRQQLLQKEQEAEGYRVKLENLTKQHINGDGGDEGDTIIISTVELDGTEVTEVETVEHPVDIPVESALN
ncbi:GA-binding protein subunit beta-2-like [Hyperolius riggenbachi]|uniref:GA-binding protein subunit beta-2-like n=1 Tax=Hyperolius riggenbachi TaxID=752182 RepID=UPI0035A2DECC